MIRGQWTISNALSLSRILLLVPISLLLLQDDPSKRWFVLALIIVTAMTDMFDGILARRFNQVTEFGKVIDPLADKTGIVVIGFILLLQHKIPLWFFTAAFLRDALILLGGLYLQRKKGITLPSNTTGKWAAAVMTVYLILSFLNLESLNEITTILLALSTLLLVLSFALYLRRFFTVMEVNKL